MKSAYQFIFTQGEHVVTITSDQMDAISQIGEHDARFDNCFEHTLKSDAPALLTVQAEGFERHLSIAKVLVNDDSVDLLGVRFA